MTLDDILTEWKTDSQIGVTNIDETGARTIKHHAKYLTYLREASKALRKAEANTKKTYSELSAWYTGHTKDENGKSYPFKLDKGDVKNRIEGDSRYIAVKDIESECLDMINTLIQIIDSLNRRGYILKTMVDYQKFSHGVG